MAGINAFGDYIRYFNSGLFIARGNKIYRVQKVNIPPFLEFVGVKEQIKNNSSTDVKMEGNMKKEDLIALGLTEEQAEKVLNANSEQLKE